MYVASSATFEAVYESGVTGLVPGIQVCIIDNEGNVVVAPTGVGIVEEEIDLTPTGVYSKDDMTAPVDPGQYTIVWSTDGSFDPRTVSVEDLVVVAIGVILPPVGPPSGIGQTHGPCSLWTNIDQITACCETLEGEDQFVTIARLTQTAEAASRTLWLLSGRLYSGACQKRVHICGNVDGCFQVLSRGHIVGSFDRQRAFEVMLDGYPVQEVTEVKIDGDVLDPSAYRLENWRKLVRIDGYPWPVCNPPITDLEDNSALYTYGQDPPITAQLAAAQLACEAYKQCSGGGADCLLPKGATRVTRQGITIEMSWLSFDATLRAWKTGLTSVDQFLNAENPNRLQRRPVISSPDISYAREIT